MGRLRRGDLRGGGPRLPRAADHDRRVRRDSAPRPAVSVLRSEKGAPELPHWRDGPARLPRRSSGTCDTRPVAGVAIASDSGFERLRAMPDARARDRRGGVHRLALRPPAAPRAAPRSSVLDKLTYAGNPANLAGVEHEFHRGDIADPEAVAAGGRRLCRDRQLRGRDPRRPIDPRRRRSSSTRTCSARCACSNGRASTTRATCRSRPTRSTATSRRAGGPSRTIRCGPRAPTARRRPAATCRCSPTSAPTASARRSPAAPTRTVRTSTRRSSCRCSSTNALDGEPLPVYGDGKQVREWLHAEDHCAGIELVLHEGAPGEIYNVGGEDHENIEVTYRILELTGADPGLIRHVEDRAGHDRRYALDDAKLRALGWSPRHSFGEGGLAGHRRLVSRQSGLVGADQVGRLPRLLRRAVRKQTQGLRRPTENTSREVLHADHDRSPLRSRARRAGLGATPPLPSTPARPATTLSAPTYILSGGGYGHGVGLSQYGAMAQAKANRSYRDILALLLPGHHARRGAAREGASARRGRTPAVKIASTVPSRWSTRPGVEQLPAGGRARREADLEAPGRRNADGAAWPADVHARRRRHAHPRREGLPRRAAGHGRAEGSCRSSTSSGSTTTCSGVVPGEMPKEWPAAALQAQAVAARSYALASLVKNRDFDLYADPRSQMYYGVAAETPATTAAVKATRGQVLMYGGKVAPAFYYSSSGGRTASSARRLRARAPLPAVARGPVGHAVALPPLEAALVHAGVARAGVRPLGARRRRPGRAHSLRPAGFRHAREAAGGEHPAQGGGRARTARRCARPPSSIGVLRVARRRPRPRAGLCGRRHRASRAMSTTAAREARGERHVASVRSLAPSATAPSPSPCAHGDHDLPALGRAGQPGPALTDHRRPAATG